MVTIPKDMVSLTLPIPEEMKLEIEEEIIKRYGYRKRGLISVIVLDAIREYLDKQNFERSKLIKKNELARFSHSSLENKKNKWVNNYNNLVSEISILLPTILGYRQETNDKDSYFITRHNLEKAISQRTGLTDKRSIKSRISMLISSNVLTPWDYNNGRFENYMINQEEKENLIEKL